MISAKSVKLFFFPCQKRILEAIKQNEIAYEGFYKFLESNKKRKKRAIKVNKNALQA